MGNYYERDIDFIKRTLDLVHQYEDIRINFPWDKQYNHTLLINCLLGLIVLPREKALSHIPKEKLPLLRLLKESGINKIILHSSIKDTRDLIFELRDCIAHFNINFISETKEFLIDRIQFIHDRKELVIADFCSGELLPFIDWYSTILIKNFKQYD